MSVEVNKMQNQDRKMPADGRRPDGPSRAKADWQNICRLYRVQWNQTKAGLIVIAGSALLLCILGIVLHIAVPMTGADYMDYVLGIPDLYSGAVMAAMIYSLITGMSVLTNSGITMLPGTVRTRFLSKILYDVSILVLGIFSIAFVHLINVGVMKLLASGGIMSVSGVLFDFSVFTRRMILLLAALFLAYQIMILFAVLSTKLGAPVTIAVIGTVGLLVIAALFTGKQNMGYAYKLLAKTLNDLASGQAWLRIFAAALVCLLLSYGIVLSMRSWPQESKLLKGVHAVAVYTLVMSCMCLGVVNNVEIEIEATDGHSETEVVEEIKTSVLEEDLAKQEVIVNDRVITPGQVDAKVLNESFFQGQSGEIGSMGDLNCSLIWCEYEEAKRCGLISEDKSIAEGSMLVRIVGRNDRFAGAYIYKDFISGLSFDIVNGKYELALPAQVLMYDDFMDSMDKFLHFDADKNSVDKQTTVWSPLELVQIYVVYHSGDMLHEEDLEQFNMYSSGLPWYVELTGDMEDEEDTEELEDMEDDAE